MIVGKIMFVWFLLLGSVLSTPADEFDELIRNGFGDFSQKGDISNIVPGIESANRRLRYTTSFDEEWLSILKLNPDNEYFKIFSKHVDKGAAAKDLTFCVYDDNMRDAAIALFRLFQNIDDETLLKVQKWALKNINTEMYMYALRLESLYTSKINDSNVLPPFIWNPNYFVNAESLAKASLELDKILSDPLDPSGSVANKISKMNPTFKLIELIVIDSNYSGWNLHKKGKQDLLNYFREDISLSSYYLGVHLLHPFWMSNEELEEKNPRFAEHYYYAHQQLMARFNLETLHIKAKDPSYKFDDWSYVPYLRYKNGLPFPTRSCVIGNWSKEEAYLKTIDIAIRECIARGLIIMKNGETLTMTDDSHINLLAKLIRANLDGIKFAKIARSVVGYGANFYPINEYNPAPSILHHPETSLKDPAYWFMMRHMLNYFTEYKNTMEPFDMSQYESDDIEIIDNDFSKITTYFQNYRFPVNNAMGTNVKDQNDWYAFLEVRQRRLKHIGFKLNFTVESKNDKNVIVRLYLGPECSSNNCWNSYNDFFELDTFNYALDRGLNIISWSPEVSDKYSNDEYYNTILSKTAPVTKYSIYRFPENLLIPRGVEEGLKLTLFVMITPDYDDMTPYSTSFYRTVSNELDAKPLGFPFHRQAKGFKEDALNYKFYNISVFHKSQAMEHGKYFSPHLY